jgi:glycosyltransferase involved in cell wall biosynthesis
MPRVSVIIPTYNCEAFIEEAVLSICRQTERDLEILVVDDGSTDCTPAIVQELAASDPRIVVKSEEHSGKAGTARNAGLACASGEYVAFLDGDDICDPERIARELAVLERFPEVDVVFHDYKKFSSDPRTDSAHSHFESLDLKNRARRHLTSVGASTYLCTEDFYTFLSLEAPVVWTCTVMLRRHLLDGDAHRRGAELLSEATWEPDGELRANVARGHRASRGQPEARCLGLLPVGDEEVSKEDWELLVSSRRMVLAQWPASRGTFSVCTVLGVGAEAQDGCSVLQDVGSTMGGSRLSSV